MGIAADLTRAATQLVDLSVSGIDKSTSLAVNAQLDRDLGIGGLENNGMHL